MASVAGVIPSTVSWCTVVSCERTRPSAKEKAEVWCRRELPWIRTNSRRLSSTEEEEEAAVKVGVAASHRLVQTTTGPNRRIS